MEFTLNIDSAGISSKREERRSGTLLRYQDIDEPNLKKVTNRKNNPNAP